MSTRTSQAPQRKFQFCLVFTIGMLIAMTFVGAAKAGVSTSPYGPLPLFFEANKGQTGNAASFLSRARGHTFYVVAEGVSLLPHGQGAAARPVTIRFPGANTDSAAEGIDKLPGRINYYRGSDPSGWYQGIPTFAKVRKPGIYPGIDFVVYGNRTDLEFDFVIAPGADPTQIRFQADGAQSVELAPNGDLVLATEAGEIRQRAPFAYQRDGEALRPVEARYEIGQNGAVEIRLGRYDRQKKLIIDPVLVYSTFLGGTSNDEARSVAVDSAGAAYTYGLSNSPDFPITAGAYDETCGSDGACDSGRNIPFVAKLSADGTTLLFGTYLGGDNGVNPDQPKEIAVDSSGNAYLTGRPSSTDYPTTSGAFDETCDLNDVYVTKLSASGGLLIYSTCLGGGEGAEDSGGIAVDESGCAFVTGSTTSEDFPTTTGSYQETCPLPTNVSLPGCTPDVFVTKFNHDGSALEYSTLLGGSNSDRPHGIAVDSLGNVYVTGFTNSPQVFTQGRIGVAFPTTSGALKTECGDPSVPTACDGDGFVTKINPEGSDLVYSTYLGGTSFETAMAIAVDSAGNALVHGDNPSADFPVTSNAFDNTVNSSGTFVSKLNADGTGLLYSTHLGATSTPRGMDVTSDGKIWVAGLNANANSFPLTSDAIPLGSGTSGGIFPGYVALLDPDAANGPDSLLFGSTLGAASGYITHANDVAVGPDQTAVIVGWTHAPTFPTTAGAFSETKVGGTTDAFVTKLGPDSPSNSAPVASDDAYSTDEDTTLSVVPILLGVLGNDNDLDNDVLSAVAVDNPAHGSLTLNAGGSFEYTPQADFHGADSFTYKANDGELDSNVATVSLTVNPINDAPVAQADGPFSGVAGQHITMDASASSDVDGDSLTYMWDFGDGTMLNTADARVSHTYADGGVFDVTLTVNDGDLTSAPFATQAEVAADGGGGQRSDVDAFLALISPAASPVEVPAGTASIEVRIAYGETILPGTFAATLNGQPLGGFTPAAGSAETVVVPIDPADFRTVLLLQVDGLRTDGKVATDRDRILIRAP